MLKSPSRFVYFYPKLAMYNTLGNFQAPPSRPDVFAHNAAMAACLRAVESAKDRRSWTNAVFVALTVNQWLING